ncbi:MAG: nucleoside monophosphate kinase [Planctomycetes bacterium]|nr:nucleoside monophosphate kinase [Planctomycetota bacterium]
MTHKALLLTGPTASGKTPLGEYLERHGLWDIPCVHFDFGAQLRHAAAMPHPREPLTAEDLEVVRNVLASGALLEDDQFHVARKILQEFLGERQVTDRTWVVLNGLPRHVGQARDIESLIRMEIVIRLECSPETVVERIRTNAGKDRTGREDDELKAVRRRLATFDERTAPLVEHYRAAGVPVEIVRVGPMTTPEGMYRQLMQTC